MTLKEHINDICESLEKGELPPNEAAVCDDIVRRLVHELGWPRFQSQIVYPQYPVEGGKVDFALCHPPSEPCVFIEVKKVGHIDANAEDQLFRYAFRSGVPIAILTDGREWHFFYPIGQGNYKERKVHEIDLTKNDSEESATRLDRYLNYESIRTSEAIEAIKKDYETVVQQRRVAIQLPEAWSKLVEEADEFLLDVVAEKVESLCGYRPVDEQVLSFLKSLERETELDRQEAFSPSAPSGESTQSRTHRTQKTPQTRLVVTMPDRQVIDHNTAATTFTEVIEKFGIERVRDLNKSDIIPIISTDENDKYTQRQSGRYYIMTHNSTKKKKILLEEIAADLGEPLKVEIV